MADHSSEEAEPTLSPSAIPATQSFDDRAAALYPDDVTAGEARESKDAAERAKEASEEGKAGEQSPAPGTYVLSVPDGWEVDPVVLKEATPVFRDLGLDNAQANKLAPLAIRVVEQYQDRQNSEFDALKTDWARQVKSDPELGGKNWTKTERLAAAALDAGGAKRGSEFRKLLDESGLGNHPAAVRFFRNIGQRLSGARPSGKPAPHDRPHDRARILYPDD